MHTFFLDAFSNIKNNVLMEWEDISDSNPDAPMETYIAEGIATVNENLHAFLRSLYETRSTKQVVIEAYMQLDELPGLNLVDLMPARGETDHFCIHELLHVMCLTLIMNDLIFIGFEREYFEGDDEDNIDFSDYGPIPRQ